jgi:hypothetical protein
MLFRSYSDINKIMISPNNLTMPEESAALHIGSTNLMNIYVKHITYETSHCI